jgi:hypothetical protein
MEGEEREVEYLPLLAISDAERFASLAARLEDAGIAWFVQSNGGPTVYVDKKRLAKARELVGDSEPVLAARDR